MLKFAVMASGGGTDFQSLIDAVSAGKINAEICCLIAGKPGIYAIERARKAGIAAEVVQKKEFAGADEFDEAVLKTLQRNQADFVVLAGYLNIVGPKTIRAYENKIINIHPALIPSFCGMGMYGKHVHEAVIDYGVRLRSQIFRSNGAFCKRRGGRRADHHAGNSSGARKRHAGDSRGTRS